MSLASRGYKLLCHLYRNVLQRMRVLQQMQERGIIPLSGSASSGSAPLVVSYSKPALATMEQLEPRLMLDGGDVLSPIVEDIVQLPVNGGIVVGEIDALTVQVNEDMQSQGVNDATSWELRDAGSDGLLDTADDLLLSLGTNPAYASGTEIDLDITSGPLQTGTYRLTALASALKDIAGNPLDGNNDGTGGDDYVREFHIIEDLVLSTDSGQAVSGAVGASDPESSPLSYSLAEEPVHGAVTFNSDGTFTYTPIADFVGTDSFAYTASDGELVSNPAMVTIRVNSISVSDSDLIAHWKLDETDGDLAVDVTGNGHDGELKNMNTSTCWTPGQRSNALDFDGGDDYVEVSSFNYELNEITASFWMNTSDTSKFGTPIACSDGDTHHNEFLLYDYRNFNIWINDYYVNTNISANDGNWHHIAVTWRSSDGQVKLYKDGGAVYSGTLKQGTTISLANLILGQEQDSFGGTFEARQAFTGLMDDVRIYSRALSQEEVADLADIVGENVNFNDQTITPYGADNGVATVEDCGDTVNITGEAFKKMSSDYEVTANTILQFDFRCDEEGNFHGIGFDSDNTFPAGNIFKLYGTDNNGAIEVFDDYDGSGWKTYRINMGAYFTGQLANLTFVHDGPAEGLFRNMSVYELEEVYWDGGGDGVSWNDALNWSDDLTPTALDHVIIDVADDPTITISSGEQVVGMLTVNETLNIAGGSLAVQTYAELNTDINLSGGTLVGGMWGGTGNILATGGTLDGVTLDTGFELLDFSSSYYYRTLTILNGLTVNDVFTVGSKGKLEFSGSQTLAGNGQVVLTSSSSRVYAYGSDSDPTTLTIGPDLTVRGRGSIEKNSDGDSVVNHGTILADNSYLTINAPLDNYGTLRATSGSLSLSGLQTTNKSEGTIEVAGGSVSLNYSWDNIGLIDVSSGTLNLGGTFSAADQGTWNRSGGTVNITGTLENVDSTLTLSAATTGQWYLSSGGTIHGGTVASTSTDDTLLKAEGGILDGVTLDTGFELLDSPNSWSYRTLTILNGLTVNDVLTLGTRANLEFSGSQTLAGNGEVLLTYQSNVFAGSSSSDPTILTIGPDLTIRGRGGIKTNSGDHSVVNHGTILADNSYLTINAPLTNEGTLRADDDSTLYVSAALDNKGQVEAIGSSKVDINGTVICGSASPVSGTEIFLYWEGMPNDENMTSKVELLTGDTFYEWATLSSSYSYNEFVVNNLQVGTSHVSRYVVTDTDGGAWMYRSAPTQTLDQMDAAGWGRVSSIVCDEDGSLLTAYSNGTIDWQLDSDWRFAGSAPGVLATVGLGLVQDGSISNGTNKLYQDDDDTWTWKRPPSSSGPVRFTTYTVNVGERLGTPDGAGTFEENFSDDPIRYFDGAVWFDTTDLKSEGFGADFGQTRSWSSQGQFVTSTRNGAGVINTSLLSLKEINGWESVSIIRSSTDVRNFEWNSDDGEYESGSFIQDTLDRTGGEYILTDTLGNQTRFFDFDSSVPEKQRGQFKSFTDVGGNLTYVAVWTADGDIAEIRRQDAAGVDGESWSYIYFPEGNPNAGKIQTVQRRHPDGEGGWDVVQQVEYAYYTDGESNGNLGDLKTATIQDGSGNSIETKYYRYYKFAEAGGYLHGLKYTFDGNSFARLQAAVPDPFSATDAEVALYATHHFEYDKQHRVTLHEIQGFAGEATDGIGTFSYEYFTSDNAEGANAWKYRTIETLQDGNQNIVYCNSLGEVMLKVFRNLNDLANPALEGREWITFYKYDDAGRLLWEADPSAVTGYDETKADLLNDQAGNYEYLADDSGLIQITDYYTSTTATESIAGSVDGYIHAHQEQHGELGTSIMLDSRDYFVHSFDEITINPEANLTVYQNIDGTGALTTSFDYSWYADSNQMESRTSTLPIVGSDQNGSETSDTIMEFYDSYGRVIWLKDADGYIGYTEYDFVTGAIVKQIGDVDTTLGGFTNLPVGWVTPAGGGQHLVTEVEVDGLGRSIRNTDPNGNITYTVYNDTNFEIRIYRGWDETNGLTATGLIEVLREDSQGGYVEMLTMAALPHVTGGRPDGSEEISDLKSLRRIYVNNADQTMATEEYFDLSGLAYSAAPHLGSEGINYYQTSYEYESHGQESRVQNAVGTITHRLFDGLGRLTAVYMGTNDDTTDGEPWSPANAAAESNMVKVITYQYDNNGVGSGNLTQATSHPDSDPTHDRTTVSLYDWRNRLVATKSGVQSSEDDATDRPLVIQTLNNLGQTVGQYVYDGDGLPMSDVDQDGLPDALDADKLRAQTVIDYDNRGRAFQTTDYLVDQQTGAVLAASFVAQTWYDRRGYAVKASDSSGLTAKFTYDGMGRLAASYQADSSDDISWADALNVDGDVVYHEENYTYDAAGNVITTIAKDRFGDESDSLTGALGDSQTGPKARVSYTAHYFDALNRRIADVNVGTNGEAAYARPAEIPQRSDTVYVTSYDYDDAGHLESIIDPGEIATRYEYDALGRSVRRIDAYVDGVPSDADDRIVEYQYDGLGHILTQTVRQSDGRPDQVTEFVYGVSTAAIASNDLLAATRYSDPVTGLPDGGNQETYEYNSLGEQTVAIAANGASSQYAYDVLGRLSTSEIVTSDGSGNPQTSYAYDVHGNLVSQTDARGNTALYEYDSLGRKTKQILPDPDGQSGNPTTSYAHDAAGNISAITDVRGNTTTFTYDLLGRTTSETLPDPDGVGPLEAPTTTYGYNIGGNSNTVTNPRGNVSGGDAALHTTTETFDRFGRLAELTKPSPDGQAAQPSWSYSYDRVSNLLSETDPLGNTTSYVYDVQNRRSQTIAPDPDGAGPLAAPVTQYAYDVVGNQISVTDALGQTTEYQYDALNRQIKAIHPSPDGVLPQPVTEYAYDVSGNLITEKDSLGHETAYTYNQLNRQTSAIGTDPDQGGPLTSPVTTYTYDLNGNLISVTDANGNTTDYEYDNLDRKVKAIEPSPDGSSPRPATTWGYDAAGNLVQTTDPLGNATTFEYDALNRQIAVTDALGNSTSTAYDAVSNVITVTDALGNETGFTYDALNRQIAVTDALGNSTSTAYDAVSNVITVTDALGNETGFTYDALNRQIAVTDALGNSTSTAYDAVSNVITVTDALGNETGFTYDALNRQIAVTDALGNSTSTGYDAVGNVVAVTDALGNVTGLTYDALNRQIAVTDALGNSTSTAYDAVSNVSSVTDALGNVTGFTYDALNRQIGVTDALGNSTATAYDAVSNVITVTDVLGNVTGFTYDALNRQIGVTDALGNSTATAYDVVGNVLS
ncbi:MAG: cadherin-like domain-containing protein, partial [Phycisphaerae bacterium]|nr:cadherin-like domain-containing protein [Phycisphaerae bacterium]